jgi:NAD/NADP transhydrogenase beta subunit
VDWAGFDAIAATGAVFRCNLIALVGASRKILGITMCLSVLRNMRYAICGALGIDASKKYLARQSSRKRADAPIRLN